MQLGLIGIHYKKTRLDIRDKVSFTDAGKLICFQKAALAGITQCMALSTCNRSEIYFMYEEEEQKIKMRAVYTEMFPGIGLERYLDTRFGEDAVAYLFRTAAGLESLVLGEDQILGQVREAIDFSRTMGYSGKELNKIVRDAVTCAKRIKTELKISEQPLSISSIGIRTLDAVCSIAGKKILVIGSGKAAALALHYVFAYPDISVTACSRNPSHARKLRREFPEISVIEYEMRYAVIARFDIVISATSSPHLTVKRDAFDILHPMCFLDLAAPRDVDPGLAGHKFVTLIDLDTLREMAAENQKERERLVKESRRRMIKSVRETSDWLEKSRIDPAIASLQQRCSEIAGDSYEYLNRKMQLSEREQKLVKKVLQSSLYRLLREPIQELKRLDSRQEQEEYKRLLEQLFQI